MNNISPVWSGAPGDPRAHEPQPLDPATPFRAVTPRRRENVVQPPALMTSLSGLQFQSLNLSSSGGYAPTPTTMNSPFVSAGPFTGVSTPMTMNSRPTSYSTTYNPQEWGPIAPGSSPAAGIGYSPGGGGMRRGLASRPTETESPPPPPYSPPRSHTREVPVPSPRMVISPAIGTAPASIPPQRETPSAPAVGTPQRSSGQILPRNYLSQSPSQIESSGTQGVNESIPPAARRAASTGDINPNGSNTRLHVNTNIRSASSVRRWEPGMPLPPPPPGPPPTRPSAARHSSHDSLTSTSNTSRRDLPRQSSEGPSIRPNQGWTSNNAALDQQPSTLAVTADRNRLNAPLPDRPVSIATSSMSHDATVEVAQASSVRPVNSSEIRERRIASRNERIPDNEVGDDIEHQGTNGSWPSDLVLGSVGGRGIVRRRTVTRSTPRSARSVPPEELGSATSCKSPFGKLTSTSASSTPRAIVHDKEPRRPYAETPPFSAGEPESPSFVDATPRSLPPKALPTPPLRGQKETDSIPGLTPLMVDQERPVSHLLHLPNDSPVEPLAPRRLSLGRRSTSRSSNSGNETFIREAEQRYRQFLQREVNADNEVDALKLFCDFVVAESQTRRKRYPSVWKNGSFDPQSAMTKMFEEPQRALGRLNTMKTERSLSRSPSSGGDLRTDGRQSVGESSLWNSYQPVLSPIASMSINDEMSSRGRAPSRWWESQTGSESGGNGQRVRRSKKESKYMGLPKEVREAMQNDYNSTGVPANEPAYTQSNNPYLNYGPNEYPPEKVGWHEEQQPAPPRAISISREAGKLDISRLITLPPPYPRHYPGVNNNHPDLVYYRTTVRSVSDLSEIKTASQNHEVKLQTRREDYDRKLQEERQTFRVRMNQGIGQGTISYADAAEAETTHRAKENEREKELVQTEFDSFREEVFNPFQSVLKDRINLVTAGINELQSKLFDAAQQANPNQAQEEGDERPELLEKLTQLKWLFEAREQLFREEYDLLSKRNAKFRAVVSLPYRQAKNQEKIKETDAFFTQDARSRQVTFAAETLQRFEKFMDIIETNVSRGVETQLSAFWDIAPSLLAVLQKVPEDLRGFAVRIPQKEYSENPSYYHHPLQYLYSLLSHAGKATYQFIESQTNLLCLLHEVKTGLMVSNCKFMEIQRINNGDVKESVSREMHESRAEEERVLTTDLKEKVGMVEGLWREALGEQLESAKERVHGWLVDQGGWDDILQTEQS